MRSYHPNIPVQFFHELLHLISREKFLRVLDVPVEARPRCYKRLATWERPHFLVLLDEDFAVATFAAASRWLVHDATYTTS